MRDDTVDGGTWNRQRSIRGGNGTVFGEAGDDYDISPCTDLGEYTFTVFDTFGPPGLAGSEDCRADTIEIDGQTVTDLAMSESSDDFGTRSEGAKTGFMAAEAMMLIRGGADNDTDGRPCGHL